MGASPCRPERPVAWVAELLLIWGRGPAVRHSKSLRLRSSSILPSSAAYNHAFQRNSAVSRRGCLWEVGGLLATALLRSLRVHVTKSVGKPDAGNPHVRFDERGTETGLLINEPQPRRSSTLPIHLPGGTAIRPRGGSGGQSHRTGTAVGAGALVFGPGLFLSREMERCH